MRIRFIDPRLFLAIALAVAGICMLAAPGGRPLFQMLRQGIGSELSPEALLWPESEARPETASTLTARAIFEAAAHNDPRPSLDRAVRLNPEEPVWLLLRALYATGKPRMVSAGPAGVEPLIQELSRVETLERGNAVPIFYRAILLISADRFPEAERALRQSSSEPVWRSGLDLLNGVGPAVVAEIYGDDLRMIVAAARCQPMVSIRPAEEAVARYLSIFPGDRELDRDERIERTLQISRLALLIRGSPTRTATEQRLSDQMLGHVRASVGLLPPGVELPEHQVIDRVIRTVSPRAGYLHVLREQRNRLARSGMVALGGTFLWTLWWAAGFALFLFGIGALLFGFLPPGGLRYADESFLALRITRLIWIGGSGLGALMLIGIALIQSATPSGMWSSAFRWLIEQSVLVGFGGALLALVLPFHWHRRGMLVQPLSVALQVMMVATGVMLVGYSAAILPEIANIGGALQTWYSPPAELSLPLELAQFPIPM
jgi:hypothetical protein